MEMIAALYETEPQYGAIFTTCLELCARDGGASLREIGDVVDDEPVLQNPKRYAMYFIDKLEHGGRRGMDGPVVRHRARPRVSARRQRELGRQP